MAHDAAHVKIMQQLKDRLDLRLTWKLGVLRLECRLDEGNYESHEVHRKVPGDYDSEFQDKYTRIAEALMAGHIDVERALQYQVEVKRGDHTACSGRFFPAPPAPYPLLASTYVSSSRDLVIYPQEGANDIACCVIFFGGDWRSFGSRRFVDRHGTHRGRLRPRRAHGRHGEGHGRGHGDGHYWGLAYQHFGGELCLASIFLGTLYWFFYGTAL